jgi:hypothetical protein
MAKTKRWATIRGVFETCSRSAVDRDTPEAVREPAYPVEAAHESASDQARSLCRQCKWWQWPKRETYYSD